MAPPVDSTLAGSADMATLTRGREIYLDQCTRCHTVIAISRHSLAEWEDILPDMSKEARLDEGQTRDVRAYVMAVRRNQP